MGKKTKEHRVKVEKRNRKIAQERYAMQNALNKMMKQMAEQQENEKLEVKVGDSSLPFEVVAQPNETGIKGFKSGNIVEFKENNPEIFEEPEIDSAGFTIKDREVDFDISSETNEVKIEKEEEEK